MAGKVALDEKCTILALMTMVFQRSASERVLGFSEVAAATQVRRYASQLCSAPA